MRLRYARLSTAGPVRPVNEDSLDFWESPDPLTRETQGGVALLADGVGGYEHGEIASRLAVEIALKEFQSEPGATKPYTLLRRMFTAACSSVHENSVAQFQGQRMATTLVASIFRDGAAYVANVGDTRAYFIRQKTIRRLTTSSRRCRSSLGSCSSGGPWRARGGASSPEAWAPSRSASLISRPSWSTTGTSSCSAPTACTRSCSTRRCARSWPARTPTTRARNSWPWPGSAGATTTSRCS